jgi:hypothetical protein
MLNLLKTFQCIHSSSLQQDHSSSLQQEELVNFDYLSYIKKALLPVSYYRILYSSRVRFLIFNHHSMEQIIQQGSCLLLLDRYHHLLSSPPLLSYHPFKYLLLYMYNIVYFAFLSVSKLTTEVLFSFFSFFFFFFFFFSFFFVF